MQAGSILAIITAPIWVPAMFAVAAVDTLVFGDRTTLANDLHDGVSDLTVELNGGKPPTGYRKDC